jgi:outer membrane protein OmpA-like peptidoglycan-associated protein
VQQRIASCDFAKTIQPHFGFASVKAFPQNSEEDDNAPVFWDEGIVFTSDRRGKLKFLDTKSGATDRNYLRLYYSKELTDGSYSKPSEFISKFNDARKNTGMASFTANKKAMYFTRNGIHLNKKNAYCLQLFEAKSDDGKHWKKTEVLPFCQKQSNYMHPAISPDGKILFFVSDKPGGVGGTDIYMSRKTKKRWTKPKNLGPNVNTEGHEGFPFMHQNGKLYFCSKGHMGLGGYDIFVTQMNEEGEWTKPINLGAPINSPADDISIFISADSTKGLFTSARAGGDDDVFLVSFIEEEIRNDSSEGLDKVITKDEIPKEMEYVPQSVLIESPLDKIKKQAGQSQANPQKTKIGKIEEKTDFLQVIEWRASAIQSGMLFSLPTVQFSEGLDSLEPKTKLELDKVLAILEKNPKLIIEIAAHVANLGDFEQKIKLTQKQAIAISTYLENKGIDRKRLLPKGYGGQQPLNKCLLDIDCTVEEHAINNRVEIKVLAN